MWKVSLIPEFFYHFLEDRINCLLKTYYLCPILKASISPIISFAFYDLPEVRRRLSWTKLVFYALLQVSSLQSIWTKNLQSRQLVSQTRFEYFWWLGLVALKREKNLWEFTLFWDCICRDTNSLRKGLSWWKARGGLYRI